MPVIVWEMCDKCNIIITYDDTYEAEAVLSGIFNVTDSAYLFVSANY